MDIYIIVIVKFRNLHIFDHVISHVTDITRTEENDPEVLYIQRKFLPSRHFYSLKQPSKRYCRQSHFFLDKFLS